VISVGASKVRDYRRHPQVNRLSPAVYNSAYVW